jgi:transcriptional regulator with XRE-family HTH domain
MPLNPEELRLARSLRELILEAGTTVEDVEGRLGWDAERLSTLLAGQKGWKFEEVLDVVSTLEVEPADFFARVYGLQGERSAELVLDEIVLGREEQALENFYDILERRFEESQKVVQEAVRRRTLWKRERAES